MGNLFSSISIEKELEAAIAKNDIAKFRLLTSNPKRMKKLFLSRRSMLHAIKNNNLEIVEYLLSNFALPYETENFMLCVSLGRIECAKLFIKYKCSVNCLDSYCYKCDSRGAFFAGFPCRICKEKFDINKTTITPLTYACKRNDYEMAEFLIENGAKPNVNSSVTPLIYALRNNNTKLVILLLKKGARLAKCSSDPESPLDYARSLGNKKLIDLFIDINEGKIEALDAC